MGILLIILFMKRNEYKLKIITLNNRAEEIVRKNNCKLVFFHWSPSCFGNIILEITHNNEAIRIVLDKGELSIQSHDTNWFSTNISYGEYYNNFFETLDTQLGIIINNNIS